MLGAIRFGLLMKGDRNHFDYHLMACRSLNILVVKWQPNGSITM
jgi:hypothetical protein